MPETITPPEPPKEEINISQLGQSKGRIEMPPELLAKAREMAGEPAPLPAPAKAEPTPAPAPKPSDAPKAKAEPPQEPHKKSGIEELRTAYDSARVKLGELEASDTATKRQLAEATSALDKSSQALKKYEEEIEKTYKPQAQRLTEVEKRLQDREEALRIRDYTATSEWHEKYVRPLAEARAEAESLMNELVVGDVDGNQRQATKDDLNAVLSARSLNDAARISKQLFGEDVYQVVLQHRTRIVGLERTRQQAFQNSALESQKWIEQQQQQAAKSRQELRAKLEEETKRLVTAEPDVFAPPDTDKELGSALQEGFDLAERAMDASKSQTVEEFVGVVAKARSAIAKSFVQGKKIARLTAELDALKKEVEGYRNSEPPVETRNGGPAAPAKTDEDTTRAALLEAANKLAGMM